METKKTNPISSVIGGFVGGMALAYFSYRRDSQIDKPSVVEKMKEMERKVYADGEQLAHTLDNAKYDAEVIIASDAKKGSSIQ